MRLTLVASLFTQRVVACSFLCCKKNKKEDITTEAKGVVIQKLEPALRDSEIQSEDSLTCEFMDAPISPSVRVAQNEGQEAINYDEKEKAQRNAYPKPQVREGHFSGKRRAERLGKGKKNKLK